MLASFKLGATRPRYLYATHVRCPFFSPFKYIYIIVVNLKVFCVKQINQRILTCTTYVRDTAPKIINGAQITFGKITQTAKKYTKMNIEFIDPCW